MWERKYIIWSNENLDIEDWKESFKEFIEINNLDIDPNDEEELYKYMVETNDEYLSDERINLILMFPVRTPSSLLRIWDFGTADAVHIAKSMLTRFQIVCTRIAIPIMQRGIWIIEAIFVAIKSTMTEQITSTIVRISRT